MTAVTLAPGLSELVFGVAETMGRHGFPLDRDRDFDALERHLTGLVRELGTDDAPSVPAAGLPAPVHPRWCDPTRCTADPASQAGGYRPGVGGEHRSAPVPLDLTTAAMKLPAGHGSVWLTEQCAPWRCDPYLHIGIGGTDAYLRVRLDAESLAPLVGDGPLSVWVDGWDNDPS